MSQSKICSLEQFNFILNAINLREGYPKQIGAYTAQSYLGNPEQYKHPLKNIYHIPKDQTTSQFIPANEFEELDETWHREPTTTEKIKNFFGLWKTT